MVLSRITAGHTVAGTEKVNQQLDMILQTPKGSVLGNSDFGIDADIYDAPASEITGKLVSELNIQTALYMPDVRIDRISASVGSEGVVVDLKWSWKSNSVSGELRSTI